MDRRKFLWFVAWWTATALSANLLKSETNISSIEGFIEWLWSFEDKVSNLSEKRLIMKWVL